MKGSKPQRQDAMQRSALYGKGKREKRDQHRESQVRGETQSGFGEEGVEVEAEVEVEDFLILRVPNQDFSFGAFVFS